MVRRNASGFTLIELLVVIAIIAILAAMLMPVFARVRENGRKASCQSNLRQLAMATMQYAQDYDETYPCAWDGVGDSCNSSFATGVGGWMYFTNFLCPSTFYPSWGSIYPYIKNAGIYQCPSDSYRLGNSYAYNSRLASTGPANSMHYGFSMADVDDDSAVVMFIEEGAGVGATVDTTDDAYFNVDYMNGSEHGNRPAGRHFDGCNLAFCDGHVKFLKKSAIKYPPNPDGAYRFELTPE